MLVHSKRRLIAWRKKSKLPVYVIGSPFVLYKNMKRIKKNKNAQGTVVCPSHSTYDLSADFHVQNFCDELKKMPKKYHPITICLFWTDYIDRSSHTYRKNGFKVVTAGFRIGNSLSFVSNFYKILSRHKYAVSNDIGSATFYAVDMRLPFFLVGDMPVVRNNKNRDVNIGASSTMVDHEIGRKAWKLFSGGPQDIITRQQSMFVDSELGIRDNVSPNQLNKLLWQYAKKDKYWYAKIPGHILETLVYDIVFNGPWGGWLMKQRYNIAKRSKNE